MPITCRRLHRKIRSDLYSGHDLDLFWYGVMLEQDYIKSARFRGADMLKSTNWMGFLLNSSTYLWQPRSHGVLLESSRDPGVPMVKDSYCDAGSKIIRSCSNWSREPC